jgi:hypothetical protein
MDENQFAAAAPIVPTSAARPSVAACAARSLALPCVTLSTHPSPGGSLTMIVRPTISAGLALR